MRKAAGALSFFVIVASAHAASATPPPAPLAAPATLQETSPEALIGLASDLDGSSEQVLRDAVTLRTLKSELAALRSRRAPIAANLAAATDTNARNQLTSQLAAIDSSIAHVQTEIDAVNAHIADARQKGQAAAAMQARANKLLASGKLSKDELVAWKNAVVKLGAAIARQSTALASAR